MRRRRIQAQRAIDLAIRVSRIPIEPELPLTLAEAPAQVRCLDCSQRDGDGRIQFCPQQEVNSMLRAKAPRRERRLDVSRSPCSSVGLPKPAAGSSEFLAGVV